MTPEIMRQYLVLYENGEQPIFGTRIAMSKRCGDSAAL